MAIIIRPTPTQPPPGPDPETPDPIPPQKVGPLSKRVTAAVSEALKGAVLEEAADRRVSEAQVVRECLRTRYAKKGVYADE